MPDDDDDDWIYDTPHLDSKRAAMGCAVLVFVASLILWFAIFWELL